jgi:hypothetical protein
MPQQVVDTGFDGCGSVRVSYSPGATPTNSPPLDDAEGHYFLVDRTDPAQALKIVLEHTLASDPYELFAARCEGTISYESYVDGQILTNTNPSTPNAVGQGHYKRYADISHSDGGGSESVDREVYNERLVTTYDDDGNPIQTLQENFAFQLPISSITIRPGQPPLTDTSSFSGHRIETIDGRKIDWETGAVSDGWSIIVYETYEWGDSELTRFRFDTDPNPISVRCLNSECDEDCIPVYDSNNAFICICRDNGEPNEIDDYDYQPYEHNTTQPHFNEYQP